MLVVQVDEERADDFDVPDSALEIIRDELAILASSLTIFRKSPKSHQIFLTTEKVTREKHYRFSLLNVSVLPPIVWRY